jgi:hypothetical protein
VRVGALHETVRQALIRRRVEVKRTSVVPKGQEWEFYGTWLIRVEDLKAAQEVDLPGGLRWDVLRAEDTGLVKGRTKIPKREYVYLLNRMGDWGGELAWWKRVADVAAVIQCSWCLVRLSGGKTGRPLLGAILGLTVR